MNINIWAVCILVGILGLFAIAAVFSFGFLIYNRRTPLFFKDGPLYHHFYNDLLEFWSKNSIRPNIPRYLSDSYSDFLQRRNEFWTAYGQTMIAALIIILLSILLLTKTITAEAGLPILSGVSGFAIAKQVNMSNSNSDRDQESPRG